ncbi:MAG: amidophosphoribosyltransferase [Acidobacteriota bacterium]
MCGVAGVFGDEKAVTLCCEALFAQQHRGQDSCGLASLANGGLVRHRGMGLVREVLTPDVLTSLAGPSAIGHVRYPTQGAATLENAQPHLFLEDGKPRFALASNGDITNLTALRAMLAERGVALQGTNDAEVIAACIGVWAFADGLGLEEAIREWMRQGRGAYSTLLLTPDRMYAFRDPHGFRPLSLGEREGAVLLASETVAFDVLRGTFREEVPPGALYRWASGGLDRLEGASPCGPHHCIFEHIYFARPDSRAFSERIFDVRRRIGEELANGDPLEADVVVPIPDSSNYIGLAYAHAKGLPFALGLVRNHYVGRSFISPDQVMRDDAVRLKFNPLPGFFEGRRVVLVDDSIVRGTTIRKLVRMMRENGAREVHLRIGSPPIRFSCYYGIDTPVRERLAAAFRSPDEVAESLGADSLRYLPMEGLRRAVSSPEHYCYACFTGDYPEGCKAEGDTVSGG